MKLLTHERQWQGGETVLALGMFDGVHEGHACLMRKANELAALHDLTSVVYTFSSHPMATFAPDRVPAQLETRSEKIQSIARLGVDAAVLRPFDAAFAALEPEAFVQSFVRTLRPRHVVIGFNYSFGCKGAGKAQDMVRFGEKYGFETHIIDEVRMEGQPVSSTRIRGVVARGDMEEAERLIGRPYTLCGVVERGKQLGRKLDFPTANLRWATDKALPPKGVYAALAYTGGEWYMAAVNIGEHPTAPGGMKMTVEANLIGYEGGEFYGRHVRLLFFRRLRDEKKFDSLKALREAVMHSREETVRFFEDRARSGK